MTGRARGRSRGRRTEGTNPERVQVPPLEQLAVPGPSGLRSGAGNGVVQTERGSEARGGGDEKDINEIRTSLKSLMTPPCGTGRTKGRGKRNIEMESSGDYKPLVSLFTKQGHSGKRVRLTSNYFLLETHPDWALYQYRVDFSPEEDRTSVRKSLLRPHREIFNGAYLFDGTVLYLTSILKPDPIELYSLRDTDKKKIRITIKSVGDVVMGDYQYLQVFNIIMRKCLDNLQLQMVGRNFYDARAKISIKEYSMELWPGYLTSIRQCENNILMNAEISYKVMRIDTALDLINHCRSNGGDGWRKVFESSIVGFVVLTDYNNRTYRIDDVDYSTRPISTFKIKGGNDSSYIDYYRNRYGIIIQVKNQPMLVSKSKPREIRAGMTEFVYLVPELCRLTGLTDEMRANFQLMRALAEHTRVMPKSRIEKLYKFNKRLKENENVVKDLASWNMKLSNTIVGFEGRILNPENVKMGAREEISAGPEADWTRTMRNHSMLYVQKLTSWAIVYLGKTKSEITAFLATLVRAADSIRFSIPQPYMMEVKNDRCGTYVDSIDTIISQRSPQLILCIVPNNRAERYAAIKKKCCIDRAVPTQVVVAKNFASKNILAISTKIAIQMNCKLGGIPWTVDIPLKGLMVVGYDVCHDAACKRRSFGAMVATLNSTLSRYYSAVTPHTCGEELSNDLSLNITKAVIKYQEFNDGARPTTIIIYRDGVGEGQIPFVHNHEVKIIKERLTELYGGTPPKMSFVIVTKRLNTRLFLNDANPPPGTVADNEITLPGKFDFFLVSQSVRQGTVSPTAYNIIDDSSGLDADKMQRLAFKLTHLYYNWSGTVRVPAPCQYAHKLAFLVSQCLHRPPNADLDNLLYFL